MAVSSRTRSKRDSVDAIREPLVFDVKGGSSASEASKLARTVSLDRKVNPAFLLISHRVIVLRHTMLKVKLVVPRKSGRLGGLAVSVMVYVNRSES